MSSATSLVFDLFGNDVSASKALKNVGKEAEASSGNMAASFKKAASAVSAAGLVAFASSIHMAADFQQQMTRLVSAAGESESNLKMVSNGVLQIARDTGVSTEHLASAMYQVESAGFHGANGLKVLTAAAQGAQVEGADATSVANALTTALDDMHKPAGDAANVMSQMVAAVGQGKMTMDDLAGSIHSVLPNASSLGMTFGQVAGALAEMTSQGVSADQATQNMNHAIISLANPTSVMTKAMSLYGLTSSDVAKQLGKKGLAGTMDELSQAVLAKMGPAGTTLLNSFNTSRTAASDLNIMLGKLPVSLQASAKAYLANQMGLAAFQKLVKTTGGATAAQGLQFIALSKTALGFNSALTAGGPASQTYTAAMAKMTGGTDGLQVALHLTGNATAETAAKIAIISKAQADASGNVKDFTMKSHNLNIEVAKMKEDVATAAITIGTELIPIVSSSVTWITKHSTVVEEAVIGLVALAVAVKTVEFAMRVATVAQTTWTGVTKVAAAAQTVMQAMFGTTAAQAQATALVQAEAAASFAESEAVKARAVAESSVEIAAALEGTDSILAGEATAAAEAAVEFSAAMDAQVVAAQGAAAEIAVAMAATVAAEEEAGAASTLAFGPVGVAVAAVVGVGALAAHALGLFGSAAKSQIKPTADLTAAISKDNLALGTNTRALVINSLQKNGAYDAGLKLGISQKTLTDATMGNAAAIEEVNAAMAANKPLFISSYGETAAQTKAREALNAAIKTVKSSMVDETAALRVNMQAAKNEAAANSEAGIAMTAQVAALKALPKYQDAVGKSLEALNPIIAQYGADLTANTVAGDANRAGLHASITAINDVATQQALAGVSLSDINSTMGKNIALFGKQTSAAGYSSVAIAGLVKQYQLTPKQIVTSFAVNIEKATASAAQIQSVIDAIYQKKIPGLTANSAQGKAVIAELQVRIDELNQGKPPALTVKTESAAGSIKALQTEIDNIQQDKVPGLIANTRPANARITELQKQINAMKGKTLPVNLTTNADTIAAQIRAAFAGGNKIPAPPKTPIGKFASGTNSSPNGWAWVGENGPELMNLPAGSKIMSHPASMHAVANAIGRGPAMSGAGVASHSVVQNYYVNVKGGIGDPAQTAKAVATELSRLKGNGWWPSNLG